MKPFLSIGALACAFLFSGCSTVYYKGMEKIGYEKRDILVKRVVDARDAQKDAKVEFASALEEFSSLVNFDGGELQRTYDKLKNKLDRSEDRAEAVHERVDAVEGVSKALFREWKSEIKQFTNPKLKQSSEDKLDSTQDRYEVMITKMRAAESKMDPVLRAFRDQVLYLKHNLNAAAISSLKSELANVEGDIGDLIRDMEASITEADQFIQGMQ